jgi:2,3-bisphosphoglycerate-independent phosphoglycerate mutase
MKKYLVVICDGMSDLPIAGLGGKTPLEYAETPNMDYIASHGVSGLARTVPEGMSPGSDTANLSIFGYNPRKYYTGRAPLEALNMGITLNDNDAAFRCNIVKIKNSTMMDFTADHIDTAFSDTIISEFKKINNNKDIEFYTGVSYRNLMVWRNYPYRDIVRSTPPHDITGKDSSLYKQSGSGSEIILELQKISAELIAGNKTIRDTFGKLHGDPTQFWIWGGGRRPAIESYRIRFNMKGNTISAVDLVNGIGRAAGLAPITVEGATGYIDTNYNGKAVAAIRALEESDIVFLHIESPDESGHEGSLEHKLRSIHDIDGIVLKHIRENITRFDDWTLLVMPDHPTPLSIRTHTSDPVPFAVLSNKNFSLKGNYKKAAGYSEKAAQATGLIVEDASTLIDAMIKGEI